MVTSVDFLCMHRIKLKITLKPAGKKIKLREFCKSYQFIHNNSALSHGSFSLLS